MFPECCSCHHTRLSLAGGQRLVVLPAAVDCERVRLSAGRSSQRGSVSMPDCDSAGTAGSGGAQLAASATLSSASNTNIQPISHTTTALFAAADIILTSHE